MMLKLLPLTALALGLSSGVALADHRGDSYRGDHRAVAVEHRGGPAIRDHREFRGGAVVRGGAEFRGGGEWRGRGFVREGRDWRGGGRVFVRNEPYYRGYHNVRRPIFVSRPIIREHYFNYYRRPALFVENFAPMAGYYWVPGTWTWNGYEWIWQPGHYQPDPNYVDQGYADPGYDY
jgi:hypothetical protein